MGWFEIQELPHDIVAIREPYHVQDVISYLIKGRESCLLWDTGLGMFDIKQIVEKLTEKPVYVVNSHYHFDHLGGNGYFDKVHVYNDEIIINRLKNGITAADVEQNFTKQAINYKGELPFDIEEFSIKPTENFVTIEDGHIFDLGNRRFKVVHTPVHSPESLMLVCEEEKLVFTGDILHPTNTCVHLGFENSEKNIDAYIAIMETLADKYKEYQLYCSHIEPMQNGGMFDEMLRALRKIKEGDSSYQVDVDGFKKYQFEKFAVTMQ